MASEDSGCRTVGPGVHREREARDLPKTFDREMPSVPHQGDHLRERLEVVLLARLEGMILEEPDQVGQVLKAPHAQLHPVPVVDGDPAAAEERPQPMEDLHVLTVLDNAELRKDLVPAPHTRLGVEGHMEAALAVDKADDPVDIQPFLLMICTHRIVTAPSRPHLSGEGSLKVRVPWDAQTSQHTAGFC